MSEKQTEAMDKVTIQQWRKAVAEAAAQVSGGRKSPLADLKTRISDHLTETCINMVALQETRRQYGPGSGRTGEAVDHMIAAYSLLMEELVIVKQSK